MSGAQLWLLHHAARSEALAHTPHGIGLMAYHGNEMLGRQRLNSRQHIRNEGTVSQGKQDLGERGLHSGAFAGGKNDDCQRG